MVAKNKSNFNPYFIPMKDADTIEQHCETNWQSGVWTTQVEVIAAATVFQVPVLRVVGK